VARWGGLEHLLSGAQLFEVQLFEARAIATLTELDYW
jgi:hypothetical protein